MRMLQHFPQPGFRYVLEHADGKEEVVVVFGQVRRIDSRVFQRDTRVEQRVESCDAAFVAMPVESPAIDARVDIRHFVSRAAEYELKAGKAAADLDDPLGGAQIGRVPGPGVLVSSRR